MSNMQRIYGRRAVLEALRSQHTEVQKVLLARGTHGAILKEVESAAEARKITVEWVERRRLDKMFGSQGSQGVVAFVQTHDFADIQDLIDEARGAQYKSLLVLADEIEDPRNLGAIARCADGAGAQGLVITQHRSADVTAVAVKASGGAMSHLPITRVTNLSQTIDTLKANDFWIAGLDAEEGQSIWEADLDRPLALVVGSEGKGMRRLTKSKCDMLLNIPMLGKMDSLNASVATGVVLYEIQRQRLMKKNKV